MEKTALYGSRDVAKMAVKVAMTADRAEEQAFKAECAEKGVRVAAVDFGGEFLSLMFKIVESAVVCARREGLIDESHLEEGALMGAAREAMNQLTPKALGLNVGGKIGVARAGEHLAVAIFCGVGLVHLNDVGLGLGHRAL